MLPFSPRLRAAFAYAEGRQLRGVSSLDLLDGIMSLGAGVAVNILKSHGLAEPTPQTPPVGDPVHDNTPVQYRACALTALSGAMTEAVSGAHQLVGIEHMLAGILKAPSPEVVRLFAEKDTTVEEVLSELRDNM
jgi:hypothetical protein